MVIKMSRYGKFLACPGYPECKCVKPFVVTITVPGLVRSSGDFKEGLAVCEVRTEWGFLQDKYEKGYIDKKGRFAIAAGYYLGSDFKEGYARVIRSKRKDYEYIDKNGRTISFAKWDRAESFSEGLAYVENITEGKGFIDKSGKMVLSLPSNLECLLCSPYKGGLVPVRNDQRKYGYVDKKGVEVIKCQWDEAGGFCKV